MNFQKLPMNIVADIIGKCNCQTIAKMNQSCKNLNNFIEKNKLDKLDVVSVMFPKHNNIKLDVWIDSCPQFSEDLRRNHLAFSRSFVMEGCTTQKEVNSSINTKIHQVLSSIKSAKCITFACLTIDDTFVQMLKSIPFQWKKVSAEFHGCKYSFPKSDCLNLWRMFKSVDEYDGEFIEYEADVINDEMILQTLPSITFSSILADKKETPNLTDRTLKFLAKNRPPILEMGPFIANFTVEAIVQLLKTVVNSRDPTIIKWCIGTIRLNYDDYLQIMEEVEQFNTEYSKLYRTDFVNHVMEIKVEYEKENSKETGSISFDLMLQ